MPQDAAPVITRTGEVTDTVSGPLTIGQVWPA